ncbi:MAG TPA: alcohol dehydrogenase catalytic domain-containing protein [Candidatus Hydrogenedentes bacterium]|nr:alcohol dehydrogenase catalytic domain-containing protein [Candidatus Hydrogenedentota bacterium]
MSKIKAARWFGPRDVRLVEEPAPQPGPHDALIRVESVGVCGSDIHYYLEGRIGHAALTGPTILGHEYAGVVVAVGEKADPSLVGKRVAVEPGIPCLACRWCLSGHYNVCERMFFPGGPGCDGAMRELMTVDARFCFPVSATLSAAVAAMIEPAAVAVHTIELAALRPGDTVFIVGLGPIGLLTAQVARTGGASRIFGVDLLPGRVEFALEKGWVDAAWVAKPGGPDGGARETLSWLAEQTGGPGADACVDATNRPEGIWIAVRGCRPAGRCVLTGISGNDDDLVPVGFARRRELTLKWCRRFLNNYSGTIALIETGRLDVASLITHTFTLDEAPRAFELVAAYADGVLKASVDMP